MVQMAHLVKEKSKSGLRLLEEMKILQEFQGQSEGKKALHSELWHACAGPLVSLPQVGIRVYYFPQGHSEQVEVSTKGTTGSHIPNYPNLPSQLLCQVQNVTLHADKDTDEIYAEMTLQPVNPEKDTISIPDFGLKLNKHPNEYFCKTLTASDTSTHGGFSVPRRAAEKLFPPLDYSMQPPTQELVVRDLHDNLWTFRHIYRGQPKRHLLTSGWSLLLGAKRLRAGDAVLFIRDEKSQLLLGVRRANCNQTKLPSSILSVDSMHIGVLAAAAHAASNRSPFNVFYNPRACPSEFVVPLVKYHKAAYGAQVSIGMRFGMLFETDDSGKRRYMGTIIGVSDLDPLRWPGSKWRNLQVEWDEPGEKHNRVSLWEIETPDSLFVFPSLTPTFKRPLHSGFVGEETEWKCLLKRPSVEVRENGNAVYECPLIPSYSSEQLVQTVLKPENYNAGGTVTSHRPSFGGTSDREAQSESSTEQKSQVPAVQNNMVQNQNTLLNCVDQLQAMESSLLSEVHLYKKGRKDKGENQLAPETNIQKPLTTLVVTQDQQRQLASSGDSNEGTVVGGQTNTNNQNLDNHLIYLNQRKRQMQISARFVQQQLEPSTAHSLSPQLDTSDLYSLVPCPGELPTQCLGINDWMLHPSSYQSHATSFRSLEPLPGCGIQESMISNDGILNSSIPSSGQEIWDPQVNYLRSLSQCEEYSSCLQQDSTNLQSVSNSCVLRDLSEVSNNHQSEMHSGLQCEVSNHGSTIVNLPILASVLDGFSTSWDADFQTTNNCLGSNVSSAQDIQSQITSASQSQGLSLQEFPDSSGVTSSSNVDFDETNLLQKVPWQQVPTPLRTYTKVQMTGSVGRSIDVTKFTNYKELRSAIACMFGIGGLLDASGESGWKLVYVDYENDVLLVGDDPWEEFINCVRCIRILSPTEVQQISEDGLQSINNTVM